MGTQKSAAPARRLFSANGTARDRPPAAAASRRAAYAVIQRYWSACPSPIHTNAYAAWSIPSGSGRFATCVTRTATGTENQSACTATSTSAGPAADQEPARRIAATAPAVHAIHARPAAPNAMCAAHSGSVTKLASERNEKAPPSSWFGA
ncbi:MAG: hypothetical protein HMLKMBBP_02464 [Planctomycetes bacterium]|nr:hypothetical protein [Planctomycetota bacterium]